MPALQAGRPSRRWGPQGALALAAAALGGCSDLRDFRGAWAGARVGEAAPLRVGPGERAVLAIEAIDARGISGSLAVDDRAPPLALASLAGAEADALAGLSLAGDPLRVFLAFAPLTDGGGDAVAVIALFDGRRVELRLLRGGSAPLYAIYPLTAVPPP
jgi:hypothetical protein